MIAVLCALAALADLTPARDAISNAEKGKLTFRMTRHTVELSGDECRALAELIRLEGEASDIPSAPIGTGHIFDLVLQVGKGQEVVRLVGQRSLQHNGKRQRLSDTRFHDALYRRFVPKEPEPEHKARLVQTIEGKVDVASAVNLDSGRLFVADPGRHSLHSINRSWAGGRTLYLTEFKDDRIKGYTALAATKTIVYLAAESLMVLQHSGAEVKLLQAIEHDDLRQPKAAALTPDGRHLIVACRDSSRLLVYRVSKDGTLAHAQTVAHETLAHPTGLAIPDSGRFIYVCNGGTNEKSALAVFERDVALGTLSFAAAAIEHNNMEAQGLRGATAMELDGERLLLTTSGSLAFWHAVGDKLTFIHCWHPRQEEKGLHNAKDLKVDAAGRVWIAASDDGTLSWYERDQSEAGYELGGSIEGLNEIQSLAVSPDGMYVYAGGREKVWVIAGPDTPNPFPTPKMP